MKAVLIDDEPDSIFTLELIINQFLTDIQIIGKYTNPEKALEEVPELDPDIIFLDVDMPRLNGFELLEKLDDKNFHIVFTTAYEDYAIKAFKYSAVDYLLKPIDIEELQSTYERIKSKFGRKESNVDYKKILTSVNRNKESKVPISTAEGIYFLKPSEIIYLLASGSYTKLVNKGGEIIFVSKTLKEMEDIFTEGFLRVHHSYIINLRFVKMLNKVEGWNIEMDNGDKIPIARRKRNEIIDMISNYAS